MFSVSFVLRTRVRHLTTPHSHRAVPHHRCGSCSRTCASAGERTPFSRMCASRRENGSAPTVRESPTTATPPRARHGDVGAPCVRQEPHRAPVVRAHRGHHHRLSLAALERTTLATSTRRRRPAERAAAQPVLHQPHLRGVRGLHGDLRGVTPARNSPATCMVTAHASPSLTSDENDAADVASPATFRHRVERRRGRARRSATAELRRARGCPAAGAVVAAVATTPGRSRSRRVATEGDAATRRSRATPVRDGGVRAVLRRSAHLSTPPDRSADAGASFSSAPDSSVSARLCCGTETRAMTGVPSPRRRAPPTGPAARAAAVAHQHGARAPHERNPRAGSVACAASSRTSISNAGSF